MKFIQIFTAFSLATPAFGAWALVDDMEGVNNWSSIQGSTGLVADPAGAGNQVFGLTGNATGSSRGQAYLTIPTIANNTTGTLFFRIRTEETGTGAHDLVVGASDVATPAAGFGSYDGYAILNDGNMDVRNGGAPLTVGAADADQWYNVWLVLNNTDDETTLYYNTSGDATSAGTLSATGGFRNAAGDLVSLLIRNNEFTDAVDAYIDDVYVDTSGQNLVNPVPEPAVSVLGALGVLGLLRRRR